MLDTASPPEICDVGLRSMIEQSIPDVVQKQITASARPLEAEFALVRYTFDFSMRLREADGETYFQVGQNDVDMPLALSGSTGGLFILRAGRRPGFINSSLPQFLRTLSVLHQVFMGWNDDTPNNNRLSEFDAALLSVDEHALGKPDYFWSEVREEMESELF